MIFSSSLYDSVLCFVVIFASIVPSRYYLPCWSLTAVLTLLNSNTLPFMDDLKYCDLRETPIITKMVWYQWLERHNVSLNQEGDDLGTEGPI